MKHYTKANQKSWEYDAYNFWVRHSGPPHERGLKDRENPLKQLKKFAHYFDGYGGIKIANICGSCGKRAIPLAVLGAEVTVFDFSKDNKRYACEVAHAAGVSIDYVLGDILEIDMAKFASQFDLVFMEGGILHNFHDMDEFMAIMKGLLKPGGQMICSDFHPFTKIKDVLKLEQPVQGYFSKDVFQGEMAHARFYPKDIRTQMPQCYYRKYTLSEIINGVLKQGLILRRFDEHPAWEDDQIPGEFTLIADKCDLEV